MKLNEKTKVLNEKEDVDKKNIELTKENEDLKLKLNNNNYINELKKIIIENRNKYESEINKYKELMNSNDNNNDNKLNKKDKYKKEYMELKIKYDDLIKKFELTQIANKY